MKWWMYKMKSWGYQDEQKGDGDTGGSGGSGGSGDSGKGGTPNDEPKGLTAEEAKRMADEKAALLRESMSRKEKIKELDSTISSLNAKLKDFEGIDPAAVRAMLAEKQAAEQKKLEEQGNFDALKKQMVEAHNAEKAALETKLSETGSTVAALQEQIANLTVGNAFATSSFLKEELILTSTKARVVYGSHFEFQDGKVVAFDKPAGAKNRTMLVDGKGDPLDFDAALEKIVEADPDKDTVKKAKSKPGAGSGTTNVPKAGGPVASETTLTGRDKIAAGLAKAGKK